MVETELHLSAGELQPEKSESEVTQSCPTLGDPMDCSLPGSSVRGIHQARNAGEPLFKRLHQTVYCSRSGHSFPNHIPWKCPEDTLCQSLENYMNKERRGIFEKRC